MPFHSLCTTRNLPRPRALLSHNSQLCQDINIYLLALLDTHSSAAIFTKEWHFFPLLYSQDAVYQAVVENAYEILEYLLTKLPSKTYDHEPRMACPIHLALHNSLNHPLKRKSLGLLLGFHYNCFCLAEIVRQMRKSSVSLPFSSSSSQARPNHSSCSNIRPQEEHLIIVKVDPQIYHWISAYDDAHQQEYHCHHHHQRQHHPLLKLEPSQENYYNYYKPHAPPIRLEVIERNDEKLPLTPQLLSHDKIKLCDLTRKLVRRTCSQYAWEKKISFHQAATSLRLPWKLINFLFLSQLLRNGGGGSSKCGGKQQSSS